jgi:cytoskeleton protein RodZ
MKTVGKQLQEARLARNWTPELASRETKIKVDRLKDLEADDYTHFNNATYARGFVRTYARALGLDEYKILRQLDNKLPDDDTANIVTNDGGVAYLPETAMPPRVAHRDFTGLYVVMGLGAAVLLVIAFVLFRAYQVGELGRWTGEETVAATTNAAPNVASSDEQPKRALPIDSNAPPPIPEPAPTNTVATTPPAADSTQNAPKALPVAPATLNTTNTAQSPAPPKALPVEPSTLNAANNTPTPATDDSLTNAPKALPVDPATLQADNTPAPTPPKALPVDPATLNATNQTPTPQAPAADNIPVNAPKALPVSPAELAAAGGNNAPTLTPPADNTPASTTPTPPPAANNGPVVMPNPDETKPLVLTASRDSFVRVTMLDTPSGDKQLYADVLRGGQSVGFNGHKFLVTVNDPSAVNITLDSVNYGPHDDHGSAPETFTVISHVQ